MKSRIVVPISLGGSRHRCVLSTSPKNSPTPVFIKAMMESYQERWGRIDEVAFFDGSLPNHRQVEVIGSIPWRLAIQPVDLRRERAKWLVETGMKTIELEVLSLDSAVLKENQRGYIPRQVQQMADFFDQGPFYCGHMEIFALLSTAWKLSCGGVRGESE